MGYKTKVQLIKRAKSEQWYICFPSALAQALELTKSEVVEWVIETKEKVILKRGRLVGGQQATGRRSRLRKR